MNQQRVEYDELSEETLETQMWWGDLLATS